MILRITPTATPSEIAAIVAALEACAPGFSPAPVLRTRWMDAVRGHDDGYERLRRQSICRNLKRAMREDG